MAFSFVNIFITGRERLIFNVGDQLFVLFKKRFGSAKTFGCIFNKNQTMVMIINFLSAGLSSLE